MWTGWIKCVGEKDNIVQCCIQRNKEQAKWIRFGKQGRLPTELGEYRPFGKLVANKCKDKTSYVCFYTKSHCEKAKCEYIDIFATSFEICSHQTEKDWEEDEAMKKAEGDNQQENLWETWITNIVFHWMFMMFTLKNAVKR